LASVLRRLACSSSRVPGKFAVEGIKVEAVSVDGRERTEALVEKCKLSFKVTYGADTRAVSAVTGAVLNDDPVYLKAAGFLLKPEVQIVMVVHSAVWIWSATSNLWQSTAAHQQISGEVDEWRNRL
jgi:hypothetical protein